MAIKLGRWLARSSLDIHTNLGGESVWFLWYWSRSISPYEALFYMPRIDVCLPVLVCLDWSTFPIRFSSLVCLGEKMTSNGLRVLGCVIRTYS